jgi:flagellin-specific chaperone FliS
MAWADIKYKFAINYFVAKDDRDNSFVIYTGEPSEINKIKQAMKATKTENAPTSLKKVIDFVDSLDVIVGKKDSETCIFWKSGDLDAPEK